LIEFDYVIVGGGSAGCVLASRLSEDPSVTVCLIEAGGNGDHRLIRTPLAVASLVPGYTGLNNWAFDTEPQRGLNNRRGFQPRGKGLGGSSAINAMVYIRGHAQDYDDWAASGCAGWGWSDVVPFFRKAETNVRGASVFHGTEALYMFVTNQTLSLFRTLSLRPPKNFNTKNAKILTPEHRRVLGFTKSHSFILDLGLESGVPRLLRTFLQ